MTPRTWTSRNAEDQWYRGPYKIQWYDRTLSHEAGYHAYVIRTGDTCWGYYVDPKTTQYRTLTEAKRACVVHAALGLEKRNGKRRTP